MFGLSIRTLLLGLFGLMIVIVVGLGAFALNKIATVNNSTVDIATNWLPSISSARELQYLSTRIRTGQARHIMSTDEAGMDSVESDLQRRGAAAEKVRKAYEALISSPEERAAYESYAR